MIGQDSSRDGPSDWAREHAPAVRPEAPDRGTDHLAVGTGSLYGVTVLDRGREPESGDRARRGRSPTGAGSFTACRGRSGSLGNDVREAPLVCRGDEGRVGRAQHGVEPAGAE